MPSITTKQLCRDEILDSLVLPVHAKQLAIEVLGSQWHAMNNALGCIELAYRRGYQAGFEDNRDGKVYGESFLTAGTMAAAEDRETGSKT